GRELTEVCTETTEAADVGRSVPTDLLHRDTERTDRRRPVPSRRQHEHPRLEQAPVELTKQLVELVLGATLPELADHVGDAIRRGPRHARKGASAMPHGTWTRTPVRATPLHASC